MESIKKSSKIVLLVVLSSFVFVFFSCAPANESKASKHVPKQKVNQPVEKLPPPQSLKSLIKCTEYYYKMNEFQRNKQSDEILPYELRERFRVLINPILEEAQKTNIYELNTLYPELGTQFYTKLIISLKIRLAVKEYLKSEAEYLIEADSKNFIMLLIQGLNSEKIIEEIKKREEKSEVLRLEWDNWLKENVDKINKTIKGKYESSMITI